MGKDQNEQMSIPQAFLIDAYKNILPKFPVTQMQIKTARELLATSLPWSDNGQIAPKTDGPFVVAYVEYGDNPVLQFKTDGYVHKSRGGLSWNIGDADKVNVLSYLPYGEVFKMTPVRYFPLPDTKGKERRFEKLSKLLKYVRNMNDVEDVSDLCITPLYLQQNQYLVHTKRKTFGICQFD